MPYSYSLPNRTYSLFTVHLLIHLIKEILSKISFMQTYIYKNSEIRVFGGQLTLVSVISSMVSQS